MRLGWEFWEGVVMQSLLIALTIATATLNPIPVPSEPCRTVSTPHGDMCVTESLKIYGDAIRTEYERI